MHCFRVAVPTTNSARDTFRLADGCYYDCDSGEVYVMAADAAEVGKMVPVALKIELLGLSFPQHQKVK
jgi:hypothetical protein